MRTIELKPNPTPKDWSMQFVDDTDYDELFNEDVDVYRADGTPLLFLRKNILSKPAISKAWSVLSKMKISPSNMRGLAGGRPIEAWIRDDGKPTDLMRVARGWEVNSWIVGYFERSVRMPYCRSCAWNLANPEKFKKLFPMVKEVDALFKEIIPDRYENQRKFAEKTSKDFLIPGTVFTTLTLNKTFRTACHKDAGDLESGFSCLSVIRQGMFKGGNLVLPEWRIAVKLDTYDLVMFDAHEFHGNTQIIPLSPDAQRFSIVYYYREAMAKCGTAKEELNYASNRKLGDPLWEKK